MQRWLFALTSAIFLAAVTPAEAATGSLAPLLASADWLNARPSAESVVGNVVIVDVFTVDCFNCRNVVPALRELRAAHPRGLVVIGIHSPETPAEKQRGYVVENLRAQGIVWPVAVDNAFSLWNAYGVDAWPTQLFFDRHGRLRATIVGDSQDDRVRSTVDALLKER